MKTFNLKLISTTFLTTLLLTGCMPDSLTKFKKDPPKKTILSSNNGTTSTPVVTESGKTIDPATLTDPTLFKYKIGSETDYLTYRSYKIGQPVDIEPVFDGSIFLDTYRKALLVKCEIVSATALPPGISLDPDTCGIEGYALQVTSDTDPSNYGKQIPYTIRLHYISKAGTTKTMDTVISLAVYEELSALAYTQNDKLLIKLSPNSGSIKDLVANTVEDDPYAREGIISSPAGTAGIIKYIDEDTSRIGVVRVVPIEVANITALSYFDQSKALPTEQYPSLTTARFISNSVGAIGKVAKLYRPSSSSTRGIVYVETISDGIYFQEGQSVDDVKTYVAAATSITTKDTTAGTKGIDDEYGIKKSGTQIIVDNDYQYFADSFTVTALVRVFEPGKSVDISNKLRPIEVSSLSPENNVTYTVSPALPSGLTLDSETGEITGAFTSTLDGASFTVTATNALGSVSTIVGLGSIYAPKDLNYSSRQLISVNSTAKFLEGEVLYQPITPPLNTNIKARILRKIGTNKLSIENLNGQFLAGASLDSGNAFYSEKSFIPTTAITPTSTTTTEPIVANYSIALTLSDATNFAVEEYISNSAGALGRIVAKEGNIVFIQFLTPGAVAKTFSEDNGVDDAETFVAQETTITQIDANNLAVTVNTPPATFAKGKDVTSNGGLGAYVYDIDSTIAASTILYLSDITKEPNSSPYFKKNQTLFDDEVSTGASENIDAVAYANSYFIENGVNVEIQANVLRGNNIVYSISPALPTGLKLDTRTGVISGKPTVRVALKEYTVTAVNLIGKSEFVFELEVRDYFKVANVSTASSFILHKYGENQHYRGCKINATDILEAQGSRDVRCFLEAEEEDLHNIKIKLTSSAGAGVCEFINVIPFSFYRFPPQQSTGTKYVYAGCAAPGVSGVPVTATATTPTAENCSGNYTSLSTIKVLPNCDAGSFNVVTYTGTDNNSDGDCTDAGEVVASSPATVNCGGKIGACLEGPVRDLLDDATINKGFRSLIYTTSDGSSATQTYSSPLEKGFSTNLRNANSVLKNACTGSKADAIAWSNIAKDESSLTNPFGYGSPYYTYNCLDAAKDIKARIRIVVRDWDRKFKINYGIDLDEPLSPAPDNFIDIMNAGVKLDDFSELYNNYEDWDDSYTSYCSNPNYFTQATCVAAGAAWSVSDPECSNTAYTNKTECLANGGTWNNDTSANYSACGTEEAAYADRFKFPGIGL